MHDDCLTENNFLLYAAKWYDNPQCFDTNEFYDDLKRFAYLKRLFGKYHESGELKERLILNHLTVIFNIWGSHATKMLFYKIDEEYYKYLKPFLILLGYMPEMIIAVENQVIRNSDIPMDQEIVESLRKI